MGMRKHYRGDVSIPIEEWENRERRRFNLTSTAAAAAAAADAAASSSRGRAAERTNPPNAPIQMSSAPPNPTAPAAATAASASWCGILAAQIAKLLFFAHLLAFVIFVVFLLVHGFSHRSSTFHAAHWFIPLLSSITASAFAALIVLLLTLRWPRLALKNSLWVSPLLIGGLVFLLLGIGTSQGLAFAVLALVLLLAEALYACWIVPRLPHAYEVLSASISAAQVPPSTAAYASLAVLAGASYAAFWTVGVGGVAAADDDDSRFGPLYVVVLLLNLTWTMQVIKYLTHAAVARLAHARLAPWSEVEEGPWEAFRQVTTQALGDVCLGAAVAPAVGTMRGMARGMRAVAGGTDEFLFSCTACCTGVAEGMVTRGNRWGFVHVGAYRKGFAQASWDVWDMFARKGMGRLVDRDITASFCFMCGTAGGSAAALVAGSWVLALDKRLVVAATVCAFLLGYYLSRIAMAWPQACVAAYHVAYAENPHNRHLSSSLTDRIRELELPPSSPRDRIRELELSPD